MASWADSSSRIELCGSHAKDVRGGDPMRVLFSFPSIGGVRIGRNEPQDGSTEGAPRHAVGYGTVTMVGLVGF